MKEIDPSVQLFIEKKLRTLEEENKKDRHKQGERLQNALIANENRIGKKMEAQEKLIENSITQMSNEITKLREEISKLYSRKWVERSAIGVGVFIITSVSAIFWNVFSEKFTDFLSNML